jgi:hypothetical protein
MNIIKSFNILVYLIKKRFKLNSILIIIGLAILFDLLIFLTWYVFLILELTFFFPRELNYLINE